MHCHDNNKKLSINQMLGVLIGIGTFTSTGSFDMQSLQLVTTNELKKSMTGGLQLFLFYLFHTVAAFCWDCVCVCVCVCMCVSVCVCVCVCVCVLGEGMWLILKK